MTSANDQDQGPGNDAYSAKLWAVYVSEAEKYDKALVETWRSNMDGILIYAGLFSASLTAFLTQSYQNLTPEPGQATIILLTQISRQLAAAANQTTFDLPLEADPFIPPTTSLVCNTLWFLSLSLSLSCALIATLLEQWARDFIHNSDICSAPVIRARVFSYLYYGLKRFNMHTVVEIVPLLLHASLLLFLAGLVAFLAPVNPVIMIVVATTTGVVAGVYLILTLLPLAYLDCPYRTPLSGTSWRIWHAARRWWNATLSNAPEPPNAMHTPQPSTIVEAIYRKATEISPDRTARDFRALVWTVKSLTSDEELEPFVESIGDVLWSPGGRRSAYDDHIAALIHDPDVQLWTRIEGLLRSCDSGLLSSEAKERRQMLCFKALWSVASLPILTHSGHGHEGFDLLPDLSLVQKAAAQNTLVEYYAVSARAIIRWKWFSVFKTKILDAFKCLTHCKESLGSARVPNLHPVSLFFERIQKHVAFFPFLRGVVWSEYLRQLEEIDEGDIQSTSRLIDNILQSLHLFSTDMPFIIMFDYLRECASLESLPHQFEFTLSTITPPDPYFSFAAKSHLDLVMHDIVYRHLERMNTTPEAHFIDGIIGILNSAWQRGNMGSPVVPLGMIEYLNRRNSDSAVSYMLDRGHPSHLISAIAENLFRRGPDWEMENYDAGPILSIPKAFTALWRLFILSPPLSQSIYQEALDVVLSAGSACSDPAIIALIKTNILKTFSFTHPNGARMTAKDIECRLQNPILPADTVNNIPVEILGDYPDDLIPDVNLDALNQVLRNRIDEGRIQILAELFESCGSSVLPNNAIETLPFIAHFIPPASIHGNHQIRLANSIRGMFSHPKGHTSFLHSVISLKIFDVYAVDREVENKWCISGLVQNRPWIDNRMARQIIQATLTDYATTLVPRDSRSLLARITSVLRGLDSLH
ncbi:hypothetical protein B0H11DRAFT_2238402 [Mycena galericulata]|nr:hypothetical protein B0H11DRAFT_2238402 [Mycena galericulata]